MTEKNKKTEKKIEDSAKMDFSSVDSQVPAMDDSKESNEKVKEHEELAEKVTEGEVAVPAENVANSKAQIAKPLVPDPISGRPVYETASDYNKAQSVKGEK